MITKRINSGEEFPPDYFGQLHDDIASMQVTGDGRYLLVSHIGGKQQIRLNIAALQLRGGSGASGGGAVKSAYAGMYQMCDVSVANADGAITPKIKIFDGISDTASMPVNLRTDTILCDPFFSAALSVGVYYYYLTVDFTDMTATLSQSIVVLSDTDPNLSRILIGRAVIASDGIVTIMQDWTNGIPYLTGYKYAGPFALSVTDGVVTVKGGIITAGSTLLSVETTTISLTSGKIFAKVSSSSGRLTASIATGDQTASDTVWLEQIGEVAGDFIDQVWTRGNMVILGRWL